MASAFGLLDFDWGEPLSDEDRDRILGKIVTIVRKWRLEVPAVLFLESSAPLGRLAGQGLVAFSPFVAPLLPSGVSDVQRLHKILEEPANVRRLIDLISDTEVEAGPDAARE